MEATIDDFLLLGEPLLGLSLDLRNLATCVHQLGRHFERLAHILEELGRDRHGHVS